MIMTFQCLELIWNFNRLIILAFVSATGYGQIGINNADIYPFSVLDLNAT